MTDITSEFDKIAGVLRAYSEPIEVPAIACPVTAGDYEIVVWVKRQNTSYETQVWIERIDGVPLDEREKTIAEELFRQLVWTAMPKGKTSATLSQKQFDNFWPIFCTHGEHIAPALKAFSQEPWNFSADPSMAAAQVDDIRRLSWRRDDDAR